MKTKSMLMLMAMIVLSLHMQAQDNQGQATKGFYFRAGGGYIAETGKTAFNNADPNGITGIEQSTAIRTDGTTVHVKSLSGTLGAGFKFNVTGGYMFNKYMGAELGFNYFHGDQKRIGQFTSPAVASNEISYIEGLDIMPAIYITPAFSTWNPYARIGAIMTGAGKLKIETAVTQFDGGGEGTDIAVNALAEVESKFSVGFAGAVGITYPITNKLSLFGELEFKNFSIKSKSAEIVEYVTTAITNGNSQLVSGQQLADLPLSEKSFVFKDEHSFSATTAAATDEPKEIPTQYVNTSGTGINVGITYAF